MGGKGGEAEREGKGRGRGDSRERNQSVADRSLLLLLEGKDLQYRRGAGTFRMDNKDIPEL